jgi:pilus assembly protein CpaF
VIFVKLELLYEKISEVLNQEKKGNNSLTNTELKKIEEIVREKRTSATRGNTEDREAMKTKIYLSLIDDTENINKDTIDDLMKQYQVNYFKNIYTLDDPKNIKKPIDLEIEKYLEKFSIDIDASLEVKLEKLSQIIYQELIGYSVIDELVFDTELNEVACNRYDYIWIQYCGIKRKIPNKDFRFSSRDRYKKIIENRICSTAKQEMNATQPIIYSELECGYRVTALRAPLCNYPTVNIRILSYKKIAENAKNEFMPAQMKDFIRLMASEGRRNVCIIGEMGSGKTTATDNFILRYLDPDLSIGVAENVHELNLGKNYPDKNTVELQYGKTFKPSEITEIFFRLNRDIVVYGEVRGSEEALEVIKAMLRQSRGSMFTFHSSSTHRVVHDLRQLLMQTGFYTDYHEAQFDVSDAIDLIIHIRLDRLTGRRYVYQISESRAISDDMTFEIIDLFTYDAEKEKYFINKNGISEDMKKSCIQYGMSRNSLRKIVQIFELDSSNDSIFEYQEETIALK